MKIFRYGLIFSVILFSLIGAAVAIAVLIKMDFSVAVRGIIKPKRSLPVRLRTRGRVVKVVSPGFVKQGQALIVLDTEATRAELALVDKSIQLIHAELAKEQGQLGNPQRRFSLKQEVNRLTMQEHALKQTIQQSRIRAPFSGRVLGVYVKPGEYVAEANQLALLLVDDSEYVFAATATPVQCRDLQPENKAWVRLDAYPYLKYGEIAARLSRVDGFSPAAEAPYNTLRFSLAQKVPFPLRNGLAGTADVISFHGTLFEYMLRSESQ